MLTSNQFGLFVSIKFKIKNKKIYRKIIKVNLVDEKISDLKKNDLLLLIDLSKDIKRATCTKKRTFSLTIIIHWERKIEIEKKYYLYIFIYMIKMQI